MPPMSVLSAPPPPPPGTAAEPPVPGGVPKLSLAAPGATPASAKPPVKPGLNIKVAAEALIKVGGKPVVKPGKPDVLRKRAALSPVAKAGVAVLVVAFAIGGLYSYRIFFPAPSKEIKIAPPTPKPKPTPTPVKVDAAPKVVPKVDTVAEVPTPTPTPAVAEVMAQTTITSDVKVNSTRIEAAPQASPAFRTFVAGASIGGVFQGTPSRALINGSIVREGMVVESALGITFDKIDAVNKVIYFKDTSGAVCSKNY